GRYRGLVAEQTLGRQDNERLAEVPFHLAAQEVEVLPRRRWVTYLNILLGTELEETLRPGAGVLRSLSFVAMGQEQDQAAAALPFRLAANDKLVNDHLGAVGEIAELRLPDHQRSRCVERVTELEAEHRRLREQAVIRLERRLCGTERV